MGPDTLIGVRTVATTVLIVMIAVACTPTGATETTETTEAVVAVPEVTQPASRQTPFCQRMLALDEELPDDPAIDTRDEILEAYREALPDVPADIAVEFRAVLESLESGVAATVPATMDDANGPIEPTPTLPLGATVPPVPTGPTTMPSEEQLVAEEGRLPDEEPAARVNAYIDFECRGTTNNPGPPPTQPGVVVPTSDVE